MASTVLPTNAPISALAPAVSPAHHNRTNSAANFLHSASSSAEGETALSSEAATCDGATTALLQYALRLLASHGRVCEKDEDIENSRAK